MSDSRAITVRDEDSGLIAFIALDSVALGPAAGGVRTLAYPTEEAALTDARRLARAMTVKCAISDLDAGGGKAVVMAHPGLIRPEAFKRLGEAIEALNGEFRTAGDAGTTASDLAAMATTTQWVHEDEEGLTGAVARGLVECLRAACLDHRGLHWPSLSATVQGCGAIGGAVARALSVSGLRIAVADLDASKAAFMASELGALHVSPDAVFTREADILAPCALGGVITEAVAHDLNASILCGAANNIVAGARAERVLSERGITWVPDVIASAGAVVHGIARTVMHIDDPSPMIDRLGHITAEVLKTAREQGLLSSQVIATKVRERMRKAGVALDGLAS
jgi:leucine dehydrogenase